MSTSKPNETIVRSIVYGNLASKLSRKTIQGHTHRWKLFIKPFFADDKFDYVKKVEFKLHETFENPTRVVTKAPFEIVETGYGEFLVQIKVFFKDGMGQKTITAPYWLRLNAPIFEETIQEKKRKFVLYEHYDEIVFISPTVKLKTILDKSPCLIPAATPFNHELYKQQVSESLDTAITNVDTEIADLLEQIRKAKEGQIPMEMKKVKIEEKEEEKEEARMDHDDSYEVAQIECENAENVQLKEVKVEIF